MKKTLVSIAAASLIVSSAMAADKGIDIVTTGQAVVYYETAENNGDLNDNYGKDTKLFDQGSSAASYGIQLNLDADLKNGFTFGSQITYLGTDGLEKNLVSNTRQNVGAATTNGSLTDEVALTKIFIAKKVANTTVKVGRQALPMSLSPLAYSEDWNVFQNTFEAALIVNSDIPDTLVVGAYVGQSNGSTGDIASFGDLRVRTTASTTNATVAGTAYMLTVQNKSIPMTTVTASYYDLANVGANLLVTEDIGADAVWADVAIADKSLPMGLKIGLQAGSIMPDDATATKFADTTALGIKVGLAPIKDLTLCAAYTSVDGDDNKVNVAVKNTGTGIKTPLFTQMIYNQDAIALDADTFMLKAAYNTGDYGTIIAQGSVTTAGKSNLNNRTVGVENDYTDLELIYKVKVSGMDLMAAYINQSWDKKNAANMDNNNVVRVVARYNF
jgi:hypothetical protein